MLVQPDRVARSEGRKQGESRGKDQEARKLVGQIGPDRAEK